MPTRPPPLSGPLRPVELATAAVLGGVTVILAVLGWILPHASVVQTLGAVPMGVVAYRHRLRALVASTVAAAVVSFLLAGTGPVYSVITCALVGGVIGDVKRRGRGPGAVVAAAVVLGPLCALASDAMLAVFSSARALTLDQIRNLVHGVTGVIGRLPALRGLAHAGDRFTVTALRDWWATVALIVILGLAAGLLVAWHILGPILLRMEWMAADDRLESPTDPRPAVPLPVVLRNVRYRYPSATGDALDGIDLALDGSELVAVVGANGSGKSTLARILAGRPPTGGEVVRAGSAGLGQPGGTAFVGQRPESQILGVCVADDVVWGLPAGASVDVDAVLAAVGLPGMGERETTTLSGGEMQRLAIAAALARRPRLLVSDESTAMVDADGRRDLLTVLADLPNRHRMTVVHVTHRAEEADRADRILHLEAGRVVGGEAEAFLGLGDGRRDTPSWPVVAGAQTVMELRGVAHTYASGTPWAQVALEAVDLAVVEGEGLLVVGGNGSGKSTLAWVLAGLLRPSAGTCRLDGRPVTDQIGAVALAFQHARLQLQRPTVGADIRAAAGIAAAEVAAAGVIVSKEAVGGIGTEHGAAHGISGANTAADGIGLDEVPAAGGSGANKVAAAPGSGAEEVPAAGGGGAEEVAAALRLVGLDPALAERPIDQLSGGQMRRVALAGLLARRPRVLVLDEPLAGLDPASREAVIDVLADLRREHCMTLIVISHDLDGMERVCGRTVRLDRGRIAAQDSPPVAVAT